MKTNWAKTTQARIASGRVTESQLRTMRTILANAINRNGSRSCTADEAELLLEMVESMPLQVEHSQARKGADWLYKMAFTSRGLQRKTEFAQRLIPHDLAVIRECHAHALPHFTLQGFDDSREYSRHCVLTPIYRCYGDNGKWLDYRAQAWQAGGNSFIVKRS